MNTEKMGTQALQVLGFLLILSVFISVALLVICG